jgi:hypothetical protein
MRWLGLLLLISVPATASPTDADNDGIPNLQDNCVLDSRNVTHPCDSDNDGYGNVCDPDFDQNHKVNSVDFTGHFVPGFLRGSSGTTDMDCSGFTTSNDFARYFVPKFKGAMGGTIPGPARCNP